ncbi:MAG: hypothetical protein LUG98_08810 [Tannerellaceae bacterium]|nr:hypothetical protein [Tannerellaceae bacterium]
MHNLLTKPGIELSLQFMQTLPGSLPEKMLSNGNLLCDGVDIKQISENSREKIIEFRLEDSTITAYYNEGEPCHSCFLFPDHEKDIPAYIACCNHYYLQIQPNEWRDPERDIQILLMDDEDVGYILSYQKR